jgi:multiple sugar transport system substrate-binding protein
LVVTSKSPTLAPDLHWAKAYLEFWAKGSTQLLMYEANNGFIPTASDTDLTKLDRLTARAMALVSGAQRITQFLDRDTRPEFAGANAMQTFLLSFLKNPMQDLAALEDSIQRFWDSLPDYQG